MPPTSRIRCSGQSRTWSANEEGHTRVFSPEIEASTNTRRIENQKHALLDPGRAKRSRWMSRFGQRDSEIVEGKDSADAEKLFGALLLRRKVFGGRFEFRRSSGFTG